MLSLPCGPFILFVRSGFSARRPLATVIEGYAAEVRRESPIYSCVLQISAHPVDFHGARFAAWAAKEPDARHADTDESAAAAGFFVTANFALLGEADRPPVLADDDAAFDPEDPLRPGRLVVLRSLVRLPR